MSSILRRLEELFPLAFLKVFTDLHFLLRHGMPSGGAQALWQVKVLEKWELRVECAASLLLCFLAQ